MAGDSTGGNIAAAVALHCRDTHRPLAAQLLVYPAFDLAGGLAAVGDDGFFTGQDDWVERRYLGGDLGRATDPRVSPLRAESHTRLAPAVIGIGHHDLLLAQNLAYATALRAAGVPVVLREYPDLVHGFSAWAPSRHQPRRPPTNSAETCATSSWATRDTTQGHRGRS